jgi:AAA-like domain/PD-(D/E)XK nuclease superfamily
MSKKFNVTGTCFPKRHYMADVSTKLEKAIKMVEEGEYFIINRPRQYGKTTTMNSLEEMLLQTGEYLVISMSFEGLGDSVFEHEHLFVRSFLRGIARRTRRTELEITAALNTMITSVENMEGLSDYITDFIDMTDRKVVVFIDEVDKSSNNQLFVNFLAMLRNKYLERDKEKTFHSIVLAGLHDVKTLKLKLRPNEEAKYNSPWNIAADFLVDMNLFPNEIKPMLEDYMGAQSVKMDTHLIADELFFYTSGYPYLVSKLCKIIDEQILPTKMVQEWTKDDVFKAFKLLLVEPNNTNFDSMFKTLRNDTALYELVYSMLMEGEILPFSFDNPTISMGVLHGILAQSDKGTVMIQNRIYRERISNMMISEWATSVATRPGKKLDLNSFKDPYMLPNNRLNLEKALLRFQAFMREQYSRHDRDFLERHGRLVFLSFMKPIINGSGYDFKEPQISEERRLDVTLTFYEHKYVVELKIWYGKAAHAEGLNQLANYLDRLDLEEGYLIIFDHKEVKEWDSGWLFHNEKKIFAVWV